MTCKKNVTKQFFRPDPLKFFPSVVASSKIMQINDSVTSQHDFYAMRYAFSKPLWLHECNGHSHMAIFQGKKTIRKQRHLPK